MYAQIYSVSADLTARALRARTLGRGTEKGGLEPHLIARMSARSLKKDIPGKSLYVNRILC